MIPAPKKQKKYREIISIRENQPSYQPENLPVCGRFSGSLLRLFYFIFSRVSPHSPQAVKIYSFTYRNSSRVRPNAIQTRKFLLIPAVMFLHPAHTAEYYFLHTWQQPIRQPDRS